MRIGREVGATYRRTPPGVRELKLDGVGRGRCALPGRTPPGVRELKLVSVVFVALVLLVAPLPGCVN